MTVDRRWPFTYAEARTAGITRRELESAGYRRLLTGIYLDARAEVDALIEARAALLVAGATALVSHHQAAALWRGISAHDERLHASVPPGVHRSTRSDVTVHRSRRMPTTYRGVPATSPTDTVLDLAACLGLVDLVVLGDSLVRRGRVTPERLVEAADQASGRGARLARRAARLVRAGVDSPMETRSRLLRVLSGLPELETDIRFYDDEGNLVRRVDAGDRPSRTAVEYDGRHHVERREQWEADLGRREEFEDEEWRIVALVAKDICRTPDQTVGRLHRIFRARGMRLGPIRDDYRRSFPGRG